MAQKNNKPKHYLATISVTTENAAMRVQEEIRQKLGYGGYIMTMTHAEWKKFNGCN